MSARSSGRLGGALHILCGLYVLLIAPWLPMAAGGRLTALMALGAVVVIDGVIFWLLPWDRWPKPVTLLMMVESLAVISAHGWLVGADGYRYGSFFVVAFVWMGLTQPPGRSTMFAPLLLVAYAAPIWFGPLQHNNLALAGALYVVPVSVLVGEAIAWVSATRERAVEAQRASEEFLRAAFDNSSVGSLVIDTGGRVVQANRVLGRMLGYPEADLVGTPAIALIHPEDQADSRSVGRDLTSSVRQTAAVERRMVRADGSAVWVAMHASLARDHAGAAAFIVAQIQDLTEQRAYEANLSYHAHHDLLTGLPNRVLLLDRLHQSLSRSKTGGAPAIVVVGLDHFRRVNEEHGHLIGDAVLQAVAGRLVGLVPGGDTVVRLGSDEFVIVCDRVQGPEELATLAWRIQSELAHEISAGSTLVQVTASVGIAIGDRGATPETMLRDASSAMHEAKRHGRDRHEFFDQSLRERLVARRETETGLRQALRDDELLLLYQPEVELASGALVGVEALVRWRRPGRGIVLPDDFIPIAEDSDLILGIGEWVLNEACNEAARWAREGIPLPVAVNLSARQLVYGTILHTIDQALGRSELDPSLLTIEVTETILLEDSEAALLTLSALKARGIRLALDDFGTGYSSMAYLHRYPFDALKIDQSFVAGLQDPANVALVAAIIDMADALGLVTVAEGIETPDQYDRLAELGCLTGQGFLMSRPITPEALRAQLDRPFHVPLPDRGVVYHHGEQESKRP